MPGQQLFQYLDENGERRSVSSQDVNDYLREATGTDFASKHFRTWGGTKTAAALFADMPLARKARANKMVLNGLIDKVAHRLGNTRAVCRKCYIHPAVIEGWTERHAAKRRWQRRARASASRSMVWMKRKRWC